jgi:hypothetical protein
MLIVPRVTSVKMIYIIKALGKFLELLKKKRPSMAQQQKWFHWDNAPVHNCRCEGLDSG